MKKTANLVTNEKGALINKSTNDSRVDAFNKLVRGVSKENLESYVQTILNEAEKTQNTEILSDLFVLIFHKRHCRGGEGEKLITYQMILRVYDNYPKTIGMLIKLLPVYGYYKDYFQLWEMICQTEMSDNDRFHKYGTLIDSIVDCIKERHFKDLSEPKNISLLSKWMPREGKHFDKSCFWYRINSEGNPIRVSVTLYLSSKFNDTPLKDNNKKGTDLWLKKKYRTDIVKLNKKLSVPEIFMCAKNYHNIEFDRVSSKALKTYTKAFLNEKVKGSVGYDQQETGNRYPNDQDRVEARKKLKEFIKNGNIEKLKGAQLDPHEILNKLMNSKSDLEKEILRAQWERKKEDVLKQVKELMDQAGEDPDRQYRGVGKLLPMIDVSGSMTGIHPGNKVEPISVALALGIMTSELASDPFKNMAISFTETPHFFSFNDGQYPDDKRRQVEKDQMGYSTQFGKAIDLMLEMCVKNKVPSEDIPNLVVFTDGQFDQMNTGGYYSYNKQGQSWNTCHEELLKKWVNAGYDRTPTIIYWNLRANTPGVQTRADHPGVQLLQGYSPSLLKFVLFGEEIGSEDLVEVETEDGIKLVKTSSITPYQTFRRAMDQNAYLPVREVLNESNEKLLDKYTFEAPESSETETNDMDEEMKKISEQFVKVEKPESTAPSEFEMI